MKRTLAVIGFVLCASSAFAQREYVTHRNYTPPNGEDVQAFFARAYPGLPVADKPGYIWQHDGQGWYHEVSGAPQPGNPEPPAQPPPPAPPPPPSSHDCRTVDPYAEPLLAWVCAIEDAYRRTDLRTNFVDRDLALTLPVVGREYNHMYPALGRIMVLSVGLTASLPHRLVVTYQYVAGERAGEIVSFVNGESGPLWKEAAQP